MTVQLISLKSKLQKMSDTLEELEGTILRNEIEVPSKLSVLASHYIHLEGEMKADLANTALEPNAYKQLHDENLVPKIFFRTKFIPEFDLEKEKILEKCPDTKDLNLRIPSQENFKLLMNAMTGHAEVIDELLEILEISKESIPTLLSGDNYSGRFLSSSSDTAIQPASLEDLVRNQFV